jgi:acyl-CoA thioesterase-1
MYRVVSVALLGLALASCSSSAPLPDEGASNSAAPTTPEAAALPVMGPERQILAVGDSLFAGYGLASPDQAYPARLEKALRARGVNARITNAGVSGDTSVAGAQRFGFVLKSQPRKPDLVIIEFGGNDVLRALPPEQTRAKLTEMLDAAQAAGVPAMLMGMLAPPNLGAAFKAKFEPIYPALAKQYGVPLVPFFLAPVIDKPDLMQPDHHHPTAEGVDAIVAATVDTVAGALPASPVTQ